MSIAVLGLTAEASLCSIRSVHTIPIGKLLFANGSVLHQSTLSPCVHHPQSKGIHIHIAESGAIDHRSCLITVKRKPFKDKKHSRSQRRSNSTARATVLSKTSIVMYTPGRHRIYCPQSSTAASGLLTNSTCNQPSNRDMMDFKYRNISHIMSCAPKHVNQ